MNILKKGAIPMTTEDNKAFIRSVFEDLNQGNLDKVVDYFTPNFVYHDAANPQVNNREEYMHFLTDVMATFASQLTIEELIAVGDKVVVRFI
jgi:ketosteroid isomerase-like protein